MAYPAGLWPPGAAYKSVINAVIILLKFDIPKLQQNAFVFCKELLEIH